MSCHFRGAGTRRPESIPPCGRRQAVAGRRVLDDRPEEEAALCLRSEGCCHLLRTGQGRVPALSGPLSHSRLLPHCPRKPEGTCVSSPPAPFSERGAHSGCTHSGSHEAWENPGRFQPARADSASCNRAQSGENRSARQAQLPAALKSGLSGSQITSRKCPVNTQAPGAPLA